MSLVIDAHNHLGDRPGAVQTGAQLVEKLDQAGVQKAVVFPLSKAISPTTSSGTPISSLPTG